MALKDKQSQLSVLHFMYEWCIVGVHVCMVILGALEDRFSRDEIALAMCFVLYVHPSGQQHSHHNKSILCYDVYFVLPCRANNFYI
jgi:hypothetical protein